MAMDEVTSPERTCYAQQRRIVVEDVKTDPIAAPNREALAAAGIESCHSVPLITRDGATVGVMSVQFASTSLPSERQTRMMDLYARIAADAVDHARLCRLLQQEVEQREAALRRERAARAEAESANRTKDDFLATVSHESRTPLNAIIGWSHMLRSGKLDLDTIQRAVETIDRNAKAQAQLISDLLDVASITAGKLRLDIAPVDIVSVVRAAVESMQPAAKAKEIQLVANLDSRAGEIAGDASRLQQVVWNLLSNAIKFTPEHGAVEISLCRLGERIEIKIVDNGQGISPEFLPLLFERFRQEDNSHSRPYGGLGLGLAIVLHLVELHGGTITAESPGIDQGATFIVTVPKEPPPESGA